jgi:hypothetical protein
MPAAVQIQRTAIHYLRHAPSRSSATTSRTGRFDRASQGATHLGVGDLGPAREHVSATLML